MRKVKRPLGLGEDHRRRGGPLAMETIPRGKRDVLVELKTVALVPLELLQ